MKTKLSKSCKKKIVDKGFMTIWENASLKSVAKTETATKDAV